MTSTDPVTSAQNGPARRSVAIFDLDGTLTNCDTFLRYLAGYWVRSPVRWWRGFFLAWGVALHYAGCRDHHWLKVWFLKHVLGGCSRDSLDRWTCRFLDDHLAKRLRHAALAAIEAARQRGDHLILASASPDLYVRVLASRLGFDQVICTTVGWSDDDRLIPVLLLGNCYGETKRRLVWAYLDTLKGIGNIAFYTDHHSDLALLETVDQPIAINPTPKLRAAALRGDMAILEW
ncbi:MAG TPA: HAD-IB family hydrolase [Methylocella sp.]|nr:HAD-IB family hydrolase [Methylocella sp.]